MVINIGGLEIYFEVLGEGKPVILLHGWGGDVNSVRPITEYLGEKYRVYALDLPGFGGSEPPREPWGIGDYGSLVSRFIRKNGLAPVFLIGHSFGGRIGIRLAASEPELIEKLVLVDSAGIKPKRSLRYYLRVYLFKTGKFILKPLGGSAKKPLGKWHALFGSQDYRAAGALRETFVKVVNEDLRELLPEIEAPTLLVWGTADKATPFSDALLMKEKIRDSRLVSLEGAGHYSYLERFEDFCRALDDFFVYRDCAKTGENL